MARDKYVDATNNMPKVPTYKKPVVGSQPAKVTQPIEPTSNVPDLEPKRPNQPRRV